MEEILKFDNVSFSYDEITEDTSRTEYAIRNVSLSIKTGEYVAVLGHNGSGKSTFAKLCNGILVPDEGQVLVNGLSTHNPSDDETENLEHIMKIRKDVGMVFQNPDNQIVATIVEEDVAFGPENLGVDPLEIRKRVDESLKAVGMYEYRGHEPHKLSGGQKQRVAIAGILAMQPRCLVLDESTAMLDPRGRREVMNTVRKLHDDLGMTVVFITHFMDEAVTADRVVVMDKGHVIMDGTPKEVFKNAERLREVGLDVPQATEFSIELSKIGLNVPTDTLNTDECVEALSALLEE